MNRQNSTYKVSKDEINQFLTLMNHGLSISFMVDIIFKDSDQILKELENGKKLNDVLFSEDSSYFQHIRILNEVLSMKDSIECANSLEKSSKGNLDLFLKDTIYPIFIFFFSFFMILFFSNFIVPSMSIYAGNDHSLFFLSILKIVFEILIVCICFSLCIFLILKYKHKLYVLYPIEIYRCYNCLQFSIILKSLLEKGLSTKDCFEMMERMHHSESIYILSKYIKSKLQQGYSFDLIFKESNYFDVSFQKFFKIGLQNGSLSIMLDIYIEKSRKEIQQSIKKISRWIQIVSYGSVACLVITVYQIMLLPLNMLSTF